MTLLSINVNKFALLRNARGTDHPNLINICKKCIKFGAQGITVHPRPDERHAKFSDLSPISNLIEQSSNIEFNIEGYPSDYFIKEVVKNHPDQVTLVPDPPEALTSSFGWDCQENKNLLKDVVNEFQSKKIRVSLFVSPSIATLENLSYINPDRVELYTFDYAKNFLLNNKNAIKPYKEVVNFLHKNFPNIKLNAGHDLNLENLDFILKEIPKIKEVSIGHALVCDAFIFGLEKTIAKYIYITNRNSE
jgi:pyridoxine 5-phosphate synthase